MAFDGFISYSHAADGRLAPAIQHGLHRLAKPWRRRRALWLFRDQTGLAATPALWSSIQQALEASDWFVLLASPEAARSPWVNREIEHWLATKSPDRILPVLTAGIWAWDAERCQFTEGCTAVPAALRDAFAEEPFVVDLRWARDSRQVSLRDPRFRDAIAQLAAPMHGISKDELEGEDVRLHRRALRWRFGAAAMLVAITLVALVTGIVAMRNARQATAAAAETHRQQQLAARQHDLAEQAAEQASRQHDIAERQQARAQQASADIRRQEKAAAEQKRLADQAAAEAARQEGNAQRQRQIADAASARARAQMEEARRSAAEAQRQEQKARDQEALARQWADKAQAAQSKAEQQQRSAVSQRLINQAGEVITEDPVTALRLTAAAQKIEPDGHRLGQLAGLTTSTHYAGILDGQRVIAYVANNVVLTSDGDRQASLWNVTDPVHPAPLSALPSGRVMAISPDGRTLAINEHLSDDALWDVTDRSHPVKLAAVPGFVGGVAFSPDGRTMVTGNDETQVTIWDLADRTRPRKLSTIALGAWDFPMRHYEFSADGRTLVVKASKATVWDITDRAKPVLAATLNDLAVRPASVAFSPDRDIFATGDWDGSVSVWDMKDPRKPQFFSKTMGHSSSVISVAFSPDGKILASGDSQGKTILLNVAEVESPLPMATLTSRSSVDDLEFDRDGKMLATVSGTTTTFWRTWDLGAPNAVGRLDVDGNPLVQGNFSADGHWFVGRMSDGTTKLWDVARPARPILRTTLPVKGPVYSVAMSPDGRTVSVANNGRNLLFDMSVPTRPVAIADIKNAGVMTFSPDGRSLAAPASGGLVLWDVSDRAHPVRLTTLEDIPNGVRSYAFSANGKVVAVGNANGSTTLWDVTDRSAPVRLAALTGARGAVGAMAFSPDGMMLATGDDQTVALWDVEDFRHPRRLASLTRHNGNVTSVAFSPDARFLATDSPSDAVMLWDVTDRARPVRIGTLMHQVSFQVSASFSPDGRTLMTGGESFERTSTGTLWDYTGMTAVGADPAKSACAIAGRGFTADEWGRYIPDMPFQRTCSR